MSQTNPQGSVDEILDRFRKWPSSDYKSWHEENELKIAQAHIEIMQLPVQRLRLLASDDRE